MNKATQPWIRGAVYDSLFILLPPFLALLAVSMLPARYQYTNDMPEIGWCVLVLFVDVAHVYSTLYNTYLDRGRYERHKLLFMLVPVLCYIAGVAIHMAGGLVFWRVLAYLAVFHFIRQQYGFMRLYSRSDQPGRAVSAIDACMVYGATLYPLIYWHCTPGRNFSWFISNDFLVGKADAIKELSLILYVLLILTYIVKEAAMLIMGKRMNVPKNLVVAGTAVSWYFGIVYFNGDLAFTMLNVLSHGIPYMALVWFGLRKAASANTSGFAIAEQSQLRLAGRWYGVVVFLGSLVLLAYLEEGLWDGLVWQDHRSLFGFFRRLPHITNEWVLAIIVPLLSLPQSTHYVLDGFIWRKRYQ